MRNTHNIRLGHKNGINTDEDGVCGERRKTKEMVKGRIKKTSLRPTQKKRNIEYID